MEYGAIGIAVLGLTSGLLLRLNAFLPIVGLLLIASVLFAALSKMSFGQAALVVIGAQVLVQVFYFLGVTIGVFVARLHRNSHVL